MSEQQDTGRVTSKLIARTLDNARLTYDGLLYLVVPDDIGPTDAVVVSAAELTRLRAAVEAADVLVQRSAYSPVACEFSVEVDDMAKLRAALAARGSEARDGR